MSTAVDQLLSPAEYLAIERAAETRSELVHGRMYAMTDALRYLSGARTKRMPYRVTRIPSRPTSSWQARSFGVRSVRSRRKHGW